MFDKLFGWGKKTPEIRPAIHFGRYSDNNKTPEKTSQWTNADNLFKEKKYQESIDAFFDYLRDDAADNVILKRNGTDFNFEIYQGSKIVRGTGNTERMQAEVSLAKMPQPAVAVMRRLLEQNFALYYSRYSLDGERLCMRFDSDINTANPNKLYYALKELATKADKQDDLLVQDFSALQPLDTEHIQAIPDAERETKFAFTQKWISETLQYIQLLDADKFSGAIAYMLLSLAFRIDFLICPEGILQVELEKIPLLYFAKDEKPAAEKNAAMVDAFKALQAKSKEDFFKGLFRIRSSFAIVAPQNYTAVVDAVKAANANMVWYRDNSYPLIAQQVCEYGISFCQYSYSLPRPLTQLFQVLMEVNYADYFTALGFTVPLYDSTTGKFNVDAITAHVSGIITAWQQKYPALDLKTTGLQFDNLTNFNSSFTTALEGLNFDSK